MINQINNDKKNQIKDNVNTQRTLKDELLDMWGGDYEI